jgi:hypothetical protein
LYCLDGKFTVWTITELQHSKSALSTNWLKIWNLNVAPVCTDPRFGIECLGKVNKVYEGDRDLMIKFYEFVTRYAWGILCINQNVLDDQFSAFLEGENINIASN